MPTCTDDTADRSHGGALIEVETVDAQITGLRRAEATRIGGVVEPNDLSANGRTEGIECFGDGILTRALCMGCMTRECEQAAHEQPAVAFSASQGARRFLIAISID